MSPANPNPNQVTWYASHSDLTESRLFPRSGRYKVVLSMTGHGALRLRFDHRHVSVKPELPSP